MGVIDIDPVAIAGSRDVILYQSWALLQHAGDMLLKEGMNQWQQHVRVWSLSVQDPITEYDLPVDLEYFLNDSGWNNTSAIPIGPVSPQSWRALKARNLGGSTITLQYIIANDKIKFYYAPSDPQAVEIDYQSRSWVQDVTTAPPTYRDHIQADDDVVLYDPSLIINALKFWYRDAKGFDTTSVKDAYDEALANALGANRPVASYSIGRSGGMPYLGVNNLPDTGYGR